MTVRSRREQRGQKIARFEQQARVARLAGAEGLQARDGAPHDEPVDVVRSCTSGIRGTLRESARNHPVWRVGMGGDSACALRVWPVCLDRTSVV